MGLSIVNNLNYWFITVGNGKCPHLLNFLFIYLSGMELPRIILKVSWFKLKEYIYIYAPLVALNHQGHSHLNV